MSSGRWFAGNRAALLENGEAYYPRLQQAIADAQREVLIETFILFDDPVGRSFQQALIAAAGRGLRVELTVDGYGSADLGQDFIDAMTRAGVRFHRYRPQRPLLGFRTNLFRRMHRKIVVIDGQLAFVGGLNIAHDHVADFGPESKQDYAVEVQGPVVREIHRRVELALARLAAETVGETVRGWWQRYRGLRERPVPDSAGPVRALFVIRDNLRHRDDIERQYRAAIRSARKRVIIANAYFFPGWRLLRQLRQAARRGVDVRLILQGQPDIRYMKWISENLYATLLKAGVRIDEYCDRPLHAKVAVVDDHWATVGSSNLDPLSLYLNLEANLVMLDHEFNRQLAGRLEHLLEHSCRRIDWQALPARDGLRQLFTFLVYHLGRRFPAWMGWRPAHGAR